ncbi:hypothetical protein SNOG_10214 [Parastagonospora nodorum SN15]|uniref:Uncharacterized protein n=1 Tax=Phaeosphaeria nodorum (strain SN15 / ATCC MYA-4574 / FGSC 10173) TaxID=321614 RepID=Q0UDF0_PHANO|nr:hypothetical protein SNOG_10214 [Parastagonospora nodorum SN15]EAT82549.1 hypothetical protein SNOG_10214 [Parastagonospora nodorum SN15]
MAELVIMSMVELGNDSSAVDVLEELSMMDDEVSKTSGVTRELEEKSMLWLALLETDGPTDDTCE